MNMSKNARDDMLHLIENEDLVTVKMLITKAQAASIADRHQHMVIDDHETFVIFGRPLSFGCFSHTFMIIEEGDRVYLSYDDARPQDPLDHTSYLPLDDLDFQLQTLARLRALIG